LISLTLENSNLLSASQSIQQRLEHILESLHFGVMTVDRSNVVRHCNKAAADLLKIAQEKAIGSLLGDWQPAELGALLALMVQRTFQRGVRLDREYEPQTAEGPEVPLGLSAVGLWNPSGKTDTVVFTLEDLTLRKEADELRRLDELKSNFVSMISHELRTPLTSMKGALHLIHGVYRNGLDETQLSLLRILSNNTDRLVRLVNDLIDVTQLETNSLMLQEESCNVEEIARQVLEDYTSAAERKEVGIRCEFPSGLPPMRLDPARTRQILSNLVDNALKFTPPTGQIELTGSVAGDKCMVRIRDSGPGIDPQFHSKIFLKFYQVDNTMTRQNPGNGLGLYIARQLALLHSGDLRINPEVKDGAEFVLTLPINSASKVERTASARVPPGTPV
ncbi:MAG: PAS domain-containing sensor histidine kinase, partial [bacterium]